MATMPVGVAMTRRLWVTRDQRDAMQWVSYAAGVIAVVGIICAFIGRIPVELPMPTHVVGMVSPTCGLTRGTVAIMRGDLALAFNYNPMSFFVLPFTAIGLARIAWAKMGRGWVNVHLRLGKVGWVACGLASVALWAYQQSNAAFIMHTHHV